MRAGLPMRRKITRGTVEPFAERVEDSIGQSFFSLVWPDEIEITNGEKSGKMFSQKCPIKNGRDPFFPKASCHKGSTRSANGSGARCVIVPTPVTHLCSVGNRERSRFCWKTLCMTLLIVFNTGIRCLFLPI